MMQFLRHAITLIALVASAGYTLDSVRADEQIAIVDVQRVVNDSIAGKAAKSNLEGQINKAKLKLAGLKSEFEKQKTELEKQSAILSGTALEQRKEALAKKQVDFQRAYQDMQQELAKANEKEIGKVIKQVNEVVKELSDKRGYAFVVEKDRQSVLFASSRIDITEEVVSELDKRKVDL
jgi:outer membrane protein